MNINGWTIEIEEELKHYYDQTNNKLAILSKDDDDEIHLTLEFDENNNLNIHPRWNVNIILKGEKAIQITTNK